MERPSDSARGFAARYVDELAALWTSIAVTDGGGKALSLETGVDRAMVLVRDRTAGGGKVLFVGNGGSAAIASHMAVDYWKNGGFRALAFNDAALLTCVSNDCGYEQVFERPLATFADPGDVLIAISSSGRSPNILAAAQAGLARPCHVVTLSGFSDDNPLRRLGELNFYVPSSSYGPVEILHLTICHAVLDGLMARKQGDR